MCSILIMRLVCGFQPPNTVMQIHLHASKRSTEHNMQLHTFSVCVDVSTCANNGQFLALSLQTKFFVVHASMAVSMKAPRLATCKNPRMTGQQRLPGCFGVTTNVHLQRKSYVQLSKEKYHFLYYYKLVFVSVFFIRVRTKTLAHTCSVLESEQSQMEVVQKTMFSNASKMRESQNRRVLVLGTLKQRLCGVVGGCANLK